MPLRRDELGTWSGDIGPEDKLGHSSPEFVQSTLAFLNAFDIVFQRARDRCELEFLFCILRLQGGTSNPGWDPFETTMEAIPAIEKLHRENQTSIASGHLELWTYGHVMESAAPYDMLFNLLHIANGGHCSWSQTNFPPKKSGAPQSPGEKIKQLQELAALMGLTTTFDGLNRIWDRDFRNAVFHSDYAFFGPEVRILAPARTYSMKEVSTLVNGALGYLCAIMVLEIFYRQSYSEPRIIPTSPHFEGHPALRWVVIVREGHGVAGVKDAWSAEELRSGQIRLRLGRFSRAEIEMLNQDPMLALLPRLSMPNGV